MLGWVAPTDYDWYRFLRERPEIREVNFWTPGGTNFRALPAGSFFKLKRQHNRIGGFGLFARFARLPVRRARDVFSERDPRRARPARSARPSQPNGAPSGRPKPNDRLHLRHRAGVFRT
jgi:hypothetical protein